MTTGEARLPAATGPRPRTPGPSEPQPTQANQPSAPSPPHAQTWPLCPSPAVIVAPTPQQDALRPALEAGSHIGKVVDGRYVIEALLGTGGMGVVYRARHLAIDRLFAVKIMRSDLAGDDEANARFVTEARAASAVGSPHIVDVTDFGVLNDGSTYIVMEHLIGRTLAQILEAEGRLQESRVLAIAAQIAEGLGDAHEAGIVHRDLKPDNILLEQRRGADFVKILDFGIAKMARGANGVTRAGQIFGTPYYMSPEQARGGPIDHRSDVYSLGAILYEMVTGQLPFDGDEPMAVLSRHLHEPVMPPSRLGSGILLSRGLDAVILRCLEKSPTDRYASMGHLLDDLRSVATGATPRAACHRPATLLNGAQPHGFNSDPPAPVSRPATPGQRRHSRLLGVTVSVLAIAGAVTTVTGLARRSSGVMRPLFVYGATRVAGVLYRSMPQIEPGFSWSKAAGSRRVALLLTPIDAEVFHNGRSLGRMPLTLDVPVGQSVPVVVKREGYWSRHVVVDDSESRRVIRLYAIPGASAARAAPELDEAPVASALEEPTAPAEGSNVTPAAESRPAPETLAGDAGVARPIPTVPALGPQRPQAVRELSSPSDPGSNDQKDSLHNTNDNGSTTRREPAPASDAGPVQPETAASQPRGQSAHADGQSRTGSSNAPANEAETESREAEPGHDEPVTPRADDET